jgi:UDP-N-acetylmuramoyl-L-alanyl-D-glutamate--2,6-diaminopimelate ligase
VTDTINGLAVCIQYHGKEYYVTSKLIGEFNLYNILAAFAASIACNVDEEVIVSGIQKLAGVRGRLERIVDNIFVDYAHTPTAIERVLSALKKYTNGNLVLVFGCGGDRDKDKRPKMGAIASRLADHVIVTSDNPRSEPPERIIDDIISGIEHNNYKVIEDRKSAIQHAVTMRRENDIVLVAGKGHEDYQIVGDKTIPFDDAEVIHSCFTNL